MYTTKPIFLLNPWIILKWGKFSTIFVVKINKNFRALLCIKEKKSG